MIQIHCCINVNDVRKSHQTVTPNWTFFLCQKMLFQRGVQLVLTFYFILLNIKIMSGLLSSSAKVDSHLDDLFKNSVRLKLPKGSR